MLKCYAVQVTNKAVKVVKTALEREDLLNRNIKIQKVPSTETELEGTFLIPTNVQVKHENDDSEKITSCLRKHNLEVDLQLTLRELIYGQNEDTKTPFQRCVVKALQDSISGFVESSSHSTQDLARDLPGSYCVWRPMLLLPEHTFAADSWRHLLTHMQEHPERQAQFFSTLASAMEVTHIAINAPIPTLNPVAKDSLAADENLIRSPTNLQPLHGDFGPPHPPFPHHRPSHADFAAAFWVSARQNGINQVWAPRYTMFSAGNVTEKARLLSMPSVRGAVALGHQTGQGCSAVDLFSGIGYFAFSYAKAGVSKVLCWDLNPWSIEGLRRGAALNKWKTHTVVDEGVEDDDTAAQDHGFDSAQLVLFCQSNAHATSYIPTVRTRVPPVRHVNCGMLPSIGEAWKIAVEALDSRLGGWLHLHETVSESNLARRSGEIIMDVVNHVRILEQTEGGTAKAAERVELQHVEKVKSVGPRMLHIVLDVWVPPRCG